MNRQIHKQDQKHNLPNCVGRGKDVCKVKYPSSHEHATKLKSPYTTALHNVTSVMCSYENRFLALTQLSLKLVHAANTLILLPHCILPSFAPVISWTAIWSQPSFAPVISWTALILLPHCILPAFAPVIWWTAIWSQPSFAPVILWTALILLPHCILPSFAPVISWTAIWSRYQKQFHLSNTKFRSISSFRNSFSEQVEFNIPLNTITGQFGVESFHAIDSTDDYNLTRPEKIIRKHEISKTQKIILTWTDWLQSHIQEINIIHTCQQNWTYDIHYDRYAMWTNHTEGKLNVASF